MMTNFYQFKKHCLLRSYNSVKVVPVLIFGLWITGCTTPTKKPIIFTVKKPTTAISETKIPEQTPPPEPVIAPTDIPEKKAEPLPIPTQPKTNLRDGHKTPLVNILMQKGLQQLRQGLLDDAEDTFERVQRIAPQYASVYARLFEVAMKKNQPANAEALARRGILLSNTTQQKNAFWQLVEIAGAKQNKQNVVEEAKTNIKPK